MCKQSENFLTKKIDLSISYTTMHPQQTCLRVGVWWDMIRCKPFFVKNFERICTYTASCERSYEGIAYSKADVRRYDKKCIYASELEYGLHSARSPTISAQRCPVSRILSSLLSLQSV